MTKKRSPEGDVYFRFHIPAKFSAAIAEAAAGEMISSSAFARRALRDALVKTAATPINNFQNGVAA